MHHEVKRFLLCTLVWVIVFHWWVLLKFAPSLRDFLAPFAFQQALYWVNIPGLPLARIMGPTHFGVEEFGALPAGPLEYALIALFWIVVSAILGLASSALCALLGWRAENEEKIQQDGST
jgi:hypothetical protein